MKFAEFAGRADEVEAATADTDITSLTADLLSTAGDALPVVARYLQGRVFPAWESENLDIGPALCYEAIARAAGRNVSASDVEERLADEGDIGAVAAAYNFGGQRGLAAFGDGGSDDLAVADVDAAMREIASAEGAGSEDTKRTALFGLFNRAAPEEARYLARLVLSEMRIGVGEGTVRDAIAQAFDVPVDEVERALQVTNDYGRVAVLARDEGVAGLSEVSLTVGRPVQAMLAQAGTVTGALEEWNEVGVETKYDGARVQIHVGGEEGGIDDEGDVTGDEGVSDDDGDVAGDEGKGGSDPGTARRGTVADVDGGDRRVELFSRNMETVTDALPEIVEDVETRVSGPAILDGEVVAVDDDGDPLPFQEVLRRFRRKHEVERMREEVALRLHTFDCLHVAGEDLLDTPLRERHDRLADLVPDLAGDVRYTDDATEIESIEADALAAGHEGIMLKNPASAYTPGDRGKNWLKRKPDVESLDLVVTGAEWGEGRRANLLGTFLLSARDGEEFEPVGKVATGITDERLAELTALLEPKIVAEEGQDVDIRPAVVFEVGYEEIQRSPTYESGYALRFPRFVEVRADKDPEDADTVDRVERLAEGENQ